MIDENDRVVDATFPAEFFGDDLGQDLCLVGNSGTRSRRFVTASTAADGRYRSSSE